MKGTVVKEVMAEFSPWVEFGKKSKEIMESTGENGSTYTMDTSKAIAYERMIESQREDRLFNDHLA